jgi:hypothetical protein
LRAIWEQAGHAIIRVPPKWYSELSALNIAPIFTTRVDWKTKKTFSELKRPSYALICVKLTSMLNKARFDNLRKAFVRNIEIVSIYFRLFRQKSRHCFKTWNFKTKYQGRIKNVNFHTSQTSGTGRRLSWKGIVFTHEFCGLNFYLLQNNKWLCRFYCITLAKLYVYA